MATACIVRLAIVCCVATVVSSIAPSLSGISLDSPDTVQSAARQVLREAMAEEREAHKAEGKDMDEFEFSGWGEESALGKKAREVGKQRGGPDVHRARRSSVEAALRREARVGEGEEMLALPAGNEPDPSKAVQSVNIDGHGAVLVRDPSALTLASARQVAALRDDVTQGAIVNTGALPRDAGNWMDLADKSLKRSEGQMRLSDIDWLLGMEAAEVAALDRLNNETLREEWLAHEANVSANLHQWFTSRGGRVTFVKPSEHATAGANSQGVPAYLEATESIGEDEVILSMPLKVVLCQLSTRHVKTSRGGRLADALKPVFKHNERWGLAMLVLSEFFRHKEAIRPLKDDVWDRAARKRQKKQAKKDGTVGSPWGPFLQSLRVQLPSSEVLNMLRGSYALDMARDWEDEADALEKYLRKEHVCLGSSSEVCSREPGRLGSQSVTATDLRWALWVVRQYGVWVTKRSTRKPFLAVVPYANLLRHTPGAGGNLTFEFDNTIRVSVGPHAAGDPISIDMWDMGDAESLLARRRVADGDGNPHNSILVKLPAEPSPENDGDLFWQLDTLRQWRKAMHLPPRLSDMWRMTEQLHLFGEDEEEQRLLSGANTRVAGLPLPTDQATPEEQLMLLNGVDDKDAQLAIYGDDRFSEWTPQLYTAPDVEDDPTVETVVEDLADSVRQLSDAVASNPSDNSTQQVINATKNFLVHGIMPSRGLDKVDQLLLRKISLLRQCGSADEYVINATDISDPLFCAVRVLLMNETDLDLVCPKADGPWTKPKCDGAAFDPFSPVSVANEEVAIQALQQTVKTMLAQYTTSVDEDESALLLQDLLPAHSLVRGAVVTRLREKQLLFHISDSLVSRLNDTQSFNFSTAQRAADLERLAVEEAERAEWRKQVLEAASKREVVVNVTVDLSPPEGNPTGLPEKDYLVVREGQSLENAILAFAQLHGIPAAGIDTLTGVAKSKAPSFPPLELSMPVVTPDGVRRVLAVHKGENATEAARKFCLIHNVSAVDEASVVSTAAEQHRIRLERTVLLEMPVTGIDGRRLVLQVREGEQHEVLTTATDFVNAYRQPHGFVDTLAHEILNRLPPTVFTVPVTTPGRRRILLRVLDGDEPKLERVVATFCKVWNLEATSVAQLLGVIRRGLHPDAMVNPQQYVPPSEEEGN